MSNLLSRFSGRRSIHILAVFALFALASLGLHALIPEAGIAHHHHPVAGDVLVNQAAGERVVFRTVPKPGEDGSTVIDVHLAPGGAVPVAHVHPDTEEVFRVLKGIVELAVDGEQRIVRVGDAITVQAGQAHGLWNPSDQPALVQVEMKPTGHLNLALTQVHGFLNETGQSGSLAEFLQMTRFAERYRVYRAGLPVWFQKAGITLLAPWARLLGFRSFYERYAQEARQRNTSEEVIP